MGLFKNRWKSDRQKEGLENIKKDWAFSTGDFSFYTFVYTLFFKLGYFWGASFYLRKNFLFRIFYFVFLLARSRLYFLRRYFLPRWLGWFYGHVILGMLRVLGAVWYGMGWFHGHVILRMLGAVRYGMGWFYGHVFLFIFYHSPPMKIYYFTRYQYHKRIEPFLRKTKAKKSR